MVQRAGADFDGLAAVIDKVRLTTDLLVPAKAVPGEPAVVKAVRPKLSELFTSFAILQASLAQVRADVTIRMSDPALSTEQRNAAVNTIVSKGRTVADGALGSMVTATDSIMATVRGAALVPRPGPVDAAQESALARRETQLQMLLDSFPAGDVMARLELALAEAVSAQDELAVWHLTASGWPELYAETRQIAGFAGRWSMSVSRLLDVGGGDEVRAARELLAALDSTYGVAAAVRVAQMLMRLSLDGLQGRAA
jgi:hypothetical protein